MSSDDERALTKIVDVQRGMKGSQSRVLEWGADEPSALCHPAH